MSHSNCKQSIQRLTFATPKQNGQYFAWPDLPQQNNHIVANERLLSESVISIVNAPLTHWRDSAKNQCLALAEEFHKQIQWDNSTVRTNGPIIATGHQCQWIHCGILSKYILAKQLVKMNGGLVLNLIVDNDMPKGLHLAYPSDNDNTLVKKVMNLFTVKPDQPMEFQEKPSRNVWLDCFNQIETSIDSTLTDAIAPLRQAWESAYEQSETLVELISLVNKFIAGEIGVDWLDLPVSSMCQTDSFHAFLLHCIKNSEYLFECYNNALDEFRHVYQIKNTSFPMANLKHKSKINPVFEMPFWIINKEKQRRPLFISTNRGAITFSDGQNDLGTFEEMSLLSVEKFSEAMTEQGIQIRPRAITLTMFARLFLGDYFIHGIGGAHYDQVTDAIISRFFNSAVPHYGSITATVYPEMNTIARPELIHDKIAEIKHQNRDKKYNPERYIQCDKALIEEKKNLIEKSRTLKVNQAGKTERKAVFEAIREINRKMQIVSTDEEKTDLHTLENQLKQSTIAYDREYYFGFFGQKTLEQLQTTIISDLATG